jgi:hypothetical protein
MSLSLNGKNGIDALWRFGVRVISASRHPKLFASLHPKKVEAIGICIVLLSAVFQLRADSYQRALLEFHLEEGRYETQFTRQKIMGLVECHQKGTCKPGDMDWIMSEAGVFQPPKAPEELESWRSRRYIAFFLGTILILIGKWNDGRPLKVLATGGASVFSRRYRALRKKFRK